MENLYLEDEGVKYTANETEQKISELLGDTVEYSISSPISLDLDYITENNLYYGNMLWVNFPEYELSAETNDITNEDIMEFSKCWYCVNQIINISYFEYGESLSSDTSDEKILTGDANLDHVVDIYDVIHISKYIAMHFEFTELQKVITDMNDDGVVNISDAVSVGMQIIKE